MPPSGQAGGLWGFLKTFMGFLFVPDKAVSDTPQPSGQASANEAEINLGNLLLRAQLERIDDVYRGLFQLQQMGAVEILREFTFKDGDNRKHTSTLWGWVDALTSDLAKPAPSGRELQPEELEAVLEEQRPDIEPETQISRSMVGSCIRAVIRLCNASGMRIRERVSDTGDLVYRYTLADENMYHIRRRIARNMLISKKLADVLEAAGDNSINLAHLLHLLGDQDRLKDLKTGIRLLSDLGLFSTDQPLMPFSYLLEIHTQDPLLDVNADGLKDTDKEMYAELNRVNRMSELRSFAMELYASFTGEDDPKAFIDEYFQCGRPEDLEDLIGRTVGSLDDPDVPEAVKSIVRKVRQEAMDEALAELRDGDEPNQFRACSIPWNEHLLVNAGPGAGKTKVLMTRAAHLIHQQGLRPEQILILAFNRAVVHEIKARIKLLFDGLGYGAFVRRLRVRTFHSFALENLRAQLEDGLLTEDRLDTLFSDFAERCVSSPDYTERVTEGIRAILVDEFQDMDDERYALLCALQQASGAGLMAIGDDDQDILRWNRRENPIESWSYFRRFTEDFPECQQVNLSVNFRSDKSVIRRSQNLLAGVLTNLSTREKREVELVSRQVADEGVAVDDFEPADLAEIIQQAQEEQHDVAVLCRTNFEAYEVYESLRGQFPHVQVQGRENLQLRRLRHVGKWLDICDRVIQDEGDLPMSPETFDYVHTAYRQQQISEVTHRANRQEYIYLNFLWDATLEENPRATLQYHTSLVRDLRMDDYLRMQGRTEIPKWREKAAKAGSASRILVSTIHKVKGLEFDSVVMMPSSSPLRLQRIDEEEQNRLRADEARLFYVGMTRAKHRLYFKVGKREHRWVRGGHDFEEKPMGLYLTGNPREVFVSWPGLTTSNRQQYIETMVKVGDELALNQSSLRHGKTAIGRLSKQVAETIRRIGRAQNSVLRVHSVYRYPVDEDTLQHFPNILDECRQRGWLYTVLVSGIIRE